MIPVTDSVLISTLSKQGVAQDEIAFVQDYGLRDSAQHVSPFAKNYQNLKTGENYGVFSGLPMCNFKGQLLTPSFTPDTGGYRANINTFDSFVEASGRVTVGLLNDQPDGKARGKIARWRPSLYLKNKVVRCGAPVLHDIDPVNANYTRNVIEWNYGICIRRIRIIEGKCLGSWIFPADPGGDVRIVYNQSGDFSVKLGQYAVNVNEEIVPAGVFKSVRVWPFELGDTLTVYPDANPESATVDGHISATVYATNSRLYLELLDNPFSYQGYDTSTIAQIGGGCGYWYEQNPTFYPYNYAHRGILLFDTSPLGAGATISAATFPVRGYYKQGGWFDINVYSSNPASNTAIAGTKGNWDSFGSTAFSTAISYDNFLTSSTFNNFAFNSSGIANISKTGISKFGLRSANADAAYTEPSLEAWRDGDFSGEYIYNAEQGSGYKPKLVVTYTLPAVTVHPLLTLGVGD